MEVYGYAPWGYEGNLVRVEVDIRRGIPSMDVIGLPGGAVREARDRIRIALGRSGFDFPSARILINLSPADLPKTGSGYDLPMALGILVASGQWSPSIPCIVAVGELGLDSTIHPVPGILAAAQKATEQNIGWFAVPLEAEAEARAVPGLCVGAASNIRSLLQNLAMPTRESVAVVNTAETMSRPWIFRGDSQILRALEVAAAGAHSALFYGPPGAGKTLAAESLEMLLPPLAPSESPETSRIWSLAGRLPRGAGLLSFRPFRNPHHQASAEGILGGGRNLLPGEVSLAHHGVLFLDEAPEFSPRVLQSLREPMEQGHLTLVRAGQSAWLPSRFQLVMTANACPCGQTGRPAGQCFCSGRDVRKYWDRIGSPLIDRMDLRLFMSPVSPEHLFGDATPDLAKIRKNIARVREIQRQRGQGALAHAESLTAEAKVEATKAARKWDWSSRAVQSLLRVARTIADLESESMVSARHMVQAIGFRKPRGEEYWER